MMGLVFICSTYIFKDFIIHVSWGRTSYLLKSKKINSRNAAHSHLQYSFRLMYFATKEEGGVIPQLYKSTVTFYLNWVILKKNCLHAKIHYFACQYRYNAPTSYQFSWQPFIKSFIPFAYVCTRFIHFLLIHEMISSITKIHIFHFRK